MKNIKKYIPTICVLAVITVACSLHVMLIWLHWPITNSDESWMDIIALHIMKNGELPIFFYGQGYMGTIQAYIGAVLFHLFGISAFTVRLGLVLLFTLFLVCTYYLTSLLYTRKFALMIVALLSLGSGEVMISEVFANGGYAETRLFGVVICLLAAKLALGPGTQRLWIRRLTWAFLGLITGLAVWSDLLIAPCLLTAGILLWLFCRDELRSWSGICLLGCFIVGVLPTAIYNLSAPSNYDSMHALAGSMLYPIQDNSVSFFQQILQAFIITLPMATGASPICGVQEPLHHVQTVFELFSPPSRRCVVVQGGWACGAVLLWCLAIISSGRSLYQMWRRRGEENWSPQERQRVICLSARLMLPISAAISFTLYAVSAPAANDPRSTSRYLVLLLLAMPAVLWPLWSGLSTLRDAGERWIKRGAAMLRLVMLLGIALVFIWGTIRIGEEIPSARAAHAQQESLTQHLLHAGATRVYSDYWTCARIIFQSQEKIACASLDQQLNPDKDRYLPYRAAVRGTSSPAYVFSSGSLQAHTFEQRVLHGGKQYKRLTFDGYVVYT